MIPRSSAEDRSDFVLAQQSAFSAKSGRMRVRSATGSSCLPNKPPFCSASISINMVSFSVVSLIAMVPESEGYRP